MSAYFVEHKLINRILSGLEYAGYNHSTYLSNHYLPNRFNTQQLEKLEKLGKKLLVLNAVSLHFRYGDKLRNYKSLIDSFVYYRKRQAPTLIELYKSIQCLSYQCCEGNIPETSALYADLINISNQLAHKIAMDSDAYNNAKW